MSVTVKALCALTLSLCLNFSALAQFDADDSYMNDTQPIEINGNFQPLGEGLAGDTIEHDRGTLSFRHVDVSIPGNSDLPVEFARKYTMHGTAYTGNHLGGWQVDVPFMTTRMRVALKTPGAATAGCFLEAWDRGFANFDDVSAYYQGFKMNIPGEGMKQVMEIPSGAATNFPYQSQHTTTATTVDHWKIYCEESGGSPTGAVIAISPNGDKYEFRTLSITQAGVEVITKSTGGRRGTIVEEMVLTYHHNLLATKVTDVNGNWVAFDYEHEFDYEFLDAIPVVATTSYDSYRLKTVRSNDGRRIDVSYNGANNPGMTIPGGIIETIDEGKTTTVSSVTAHGRTWNYEYAQTGDANYVTVDSFKNLRRVVLPDGRDWILNTPIQHHRAYRGYNSYRCDVIDDNDPTPQTTAMHWVNDIYVEHPSGARVDFDFQVIKNPIWKLGTLSTITNHLACNNPDPEYTISNAVVQKTITAPSAPTATWTFSYDQTAFNDPNLGEVKRRTETKPDGSTVERMVLINNESDVVRTTISGTGVNYVEEVDYTKLVTFNEHDTIGVLDNHKRYKNPALKKPTQTDISVDGSSFQSVNSYNTSLSSSSYSYGQPTSMTETGTGAGSRVTSVTYAQERDDWVLSLVNTITKNSTLFDDFNYDSKGRLTQHKKFGHTKANITYHLSGDAAGKIHTVSDALNRTYTLTSYKRGKPRIVQQPDSTSITRVINDNGWVTSQTDARGTVTGYQYNNAGWLTRIDRPSPWADTIFSYGNLGNGLTQTATRGNGRTVKTMDGYHRIILIKTDDLTGHSSSRYVKTTYDGLGRPIFNSLPSTSSNPTTGVDTTYDALGRVTESRETVSPFAATTNAYLSGHRMRVTDAGGGQTTTTYRSYGAPNNNEPMIIVDATGTTTTMTRDIHGNITNMNQSGNLNGHPVNVDRKFWYDSRYRLCRHRAPEFGDQLFSYDNANQLTASSRGEPAGTNCAAPTSNIRTTYDYYPTGKVKNTIFPSGTAQIWRQYDANGNLTNVNRGGINWTYRYNTLNALDRETLVLDGRTYQITHNYNSDGHVTSRQYPYGSLITMNPDGFGQPREHRIGGTSYVSNIAYHPNGAVASANYGNGRNYTQSLTTRQQPYDIKVQGSGTIVNLRHAYNALGKITSIVDNAVSGQNRTFTYDARGRVLTASGPWGSGSFEYDGLDNIRKKTLGSRTVEIDINNSTNLPTQFRDTNEANAWQAVAHDTRGNMIDNGLWAHGAVDLAYDHANQPVTMNGSGITSSFTYDGNLKRVKSVQNGKTTYWVYSRLTGTPLYADEVTDNIKTRYIRGGGAQVRIKGGTPEYTHLDHLGTPIAASSSSGNLSWREHYTPFGEKWQSDFANDNDVAYTGHVHDNATKLTYMQARYYDASLGRFLSSDPIGYQDQVNLYAYVHNDPLNLLDPSGECTYDEEGNPVSGFCIDPGLSDEQRQMIEDIIAEISEEDSIFEDVDELAEKENKLVIITLGDKNRFLPDSFDAFVAIGNSEEKGAGAGGTITINPTSNESARFVNANNPSASFVGQTLSPLAGGIVAVAVHEGMHALDALNGNLDFVSDLAISPFNMFTASVSESRAIMRANSYREAIGAAWRRVSYESSPSSDRRVQ